MTGGSPSSFPGRDRPPDAIVIGAGLGGLAAAARLATAGAAVVVLERNHHPGGTAWEFSRHGFSFPMGPLGHGNPGLVGRIMDSLSPVATPPKPAPLAPPHRGQRMRYRLRAFGLDLPLSGPFDVLVEAIGEAFAQDAAGARRFFDEVVSITGSLKGTVRVMSPDVVSLLGLPAKEWIGRRVGDPRLRRILGSQGTGEPYAGVPLTAAMWDLIAGEEGIVLPEGGIGALATDLLGVVRGAGGAVHLGCPVAGIAVEGGRAIGVVTASGERIATGAVIANADVKTTFLRLLTPGDVAPGWRAAVASAPLTGSILQVSLGIDPSRADLAAFDRADRIIVRRAGAPDDPPPWGGPGDDPGAVADKEIEIALWRREEGRASLVLRVPARHGDFTRFRPAPGRRSPAYAPHKARLAAALVAAAEAVVPGLAGATRVTDVATPLTFEERGGRFGGSVAGWSWDFGEVDGGAPRDFTVTPVTGLYLAGCQARSALVLGGVPTALVTGVAAAEAALRGDGPVTPAMTPVPSPRPGG